MDAEDRAIINPVALGCAVKTEVAEATSVFCSCWGQFACSLAVLASFWAFWVVSFLPSRGIFCGLPYAFGGVFGRFSGVTDGIPCPFGGILGGLAGVFSGVAQVVSGLFQVLLGTVGLAVGAVGVKAVHLAVFVGVVGSVALVSYGTTGVGLLLGSVVPTVGRGAGIVVAAGGERQPQDEDERGGNPVAHGIPSLAVS